MAPELKGIKNIIFDLGGVILDLDVKMTVKAFREIGFREDMFDGKLTFSDKIFYQFQTGEVTARQFRNRVREILGKPDISDQQIDYAWCNMMIGIPGTRLDTIKNLRRKFKIILFSNTNEIHIRKLEKDFRKENGIPFISLFDKVYYSHQIHAAKPALNSFLKVIALSGINPEETLFIDDIDKNIEGAVMAGLKTYWLREGSDIGEIFK